MWEQGIVTRCWAAASPEHDGLARKQLDLVTRMGIETKAHDDELLGFDLVVDASLGIGSSGHPREPLAGMIRGPRSSGIQVLAVDLPSGMRSVAGNAVLPFPGMTRDGSGHPTFLGTPARSRAGRRSSPEAPFA